MELRAPKGACIIFFIYCYKYHAPIGAFIDELRVRFNENQLACFSFSL